MLGFRKYLEEQKKKASTEGGSGFWDTVSRHSGGYLPPPGPRAGEISWGSKKSLGGPENKSDYIPPAGPHAGEIGWNKKSFNDKPAGELAQNSPESGKKPKKKK